MFPKLTNHLDLVFMMWNDPKKQQQITGKSMTSYLINEINKCFFPNNKVKRPTSESNLANQTYHFKKIYKCLSLPIDVVSYSINDVPIQGKKKWKKQKSESSGI